MNLFSREYALFDTISLPPILKSNIIFQWVVGSHFYFYSKHDCLNNSLKWISIWLVPNIVYDLQLVRRLQGQEGDVVGEEEPATPKKIFQLLNQVIVQSNT